jgi:hypothetical protein
MADTIVDMVTIYISELYFAVFSVLIKNPAF